jgi:hypothetical protein
MNCPENQVSNTVTVLLGNGDGMFTPAANPATGADPVQLSLHDSVSGAMYTECAVDADHFGFTVKMLVETTLPHRAQPGKQDDHGWAGCRAAVRAYPQADSGVVDSLKVAS